MLLSACERAKTPDLDQHSIRLFRPAVPSAMAHGALPDAPPDAIPFASRSGARVLIDALRVHGAEKAFCVPGESFLAALDALYESKEDIELIVCRHEAAAAFMAEAWGKATGTPGIAFVTRAPGAMNAAVGLHTAHQDSTPMLLFIGQAARGMLEREAFQELDYRRVFGSMAKWVVQIDDAARIPEFVSRAYHMALSGRPGPVVLVLPEDMLSDEVRVADAPPHLIARCSPAAQDMAQLEGLLADARRPLLLLGGGGWTEPARAQMQRFAEKFQLPVACSFRRQDAFDNTHALYAGDVGIAINPALARRVKDADVLIAVGARIGEMPSSGYTLLDVPKTRQTLVHVLPGGEELGKVYHASLPIRADAAGFAAAVQSLAAPHSVPWLDWTARARADYKSWSRPPPQPGPVDMGKVMAVLKRRLGADAVLTNGAGNYTVWAHRFHAFSRGRTQIAPTSGTMGYGLPAAIAAKLAMPERQVICFAGDGCFLMLGQELATAVRYRLPIVVLVVNNNMYGTIRMHQEREYPGRVHGTDLTNPDFTSFARSFGARGALIEDDTAFDAVLIDALSQSALPTVIELRVDPQALTPNRTLDQMRELGMQKQKA